MSATHAGYRHLAATAATLAAATIVLSLSHLPTQAQTGHMLVIPASDGYGFDDCLAGKNACGQTIADAWCEAHGMTAATSFGRADDVTATIKPQPEIASAKVEVGSIIVNCRD